MIRNVCFRLAPLVVMGGALLAQNEHSSASDHLQRALRFADLNNWSGAAADFKTAEEMFDAVGDHRNAFYAQLGKIRATATQRQLPTTSAELAANLEQNQLLQTDKDLRMFCLIVKGDVDGEIDSGAMRRDWEEVQRLARELGNEKWQNRSLGQLGLAAFYEGDLETARKNVAAALITASKTKDAGAQIRFLTAAGIGLRQAHMAGMSLQYFDGALKIAVANPDAGYPFLTNEARLETLTDMGQTDAAQRLADEIMAKAEEQSLPQHQVTVLALQAHVASARKDTDRALLLFNEVLEVAKSRGLVREMADAETELAGIYRARGDLDKAERFAESAITSAVDTGNAWAVPQCLGRLAEIKVSRGQYTAAEEIYDRAGNFIDGMLGKYSGLPEKTALIKASSELYTQHFSLIADRLHDPQKAYGVVEQVRGRVMTDLLIAGSVASSEAKKEQQHLSALQLKLMSARSASEARRLRDQIFLVEQARWVTPDIITLKNQVHRTIGIDQVQHALSPSSVILEYVVAAPKSYCLVISRTSTRIIPLASQQDIEAHVKTYLQAVKAKKQAQDEARGLYDILLAPIQEAREKPNLIIVRDGPLHLLPFDALVDTSGRYAAEYHTIVYSPSATASYLAGRSEKTPGRTPHGLLAIGGVPYNRGELKEVPATRGYDETALSDLPASKDEVLAADAAIPDRANTILLGPKANEAAFKRSALSEYRILHLAVHGFASLSDADQSALVMLSDPVAGEDGLLHPAEIVQLKLRSSLAILSACDTAIGPVQGEEGIETLSRAFLLAGAQDVVSTLWSVDDTFSLVLMKQFYQHLAAGESAPVSLAGAKRDVLHKYGAAALPYFWAGYTIEGAFEAAMFRPASKEKPNVNQSKRAK
jgi:CHAT domain-containing protein